MTYLDDREIREQMYRAFATRATEPERDNRPLLARILELRREKARLLGFPDFADFVLHDRMAHKGEHAMKFLEDLKVKTDPFFAKENAALEAFAGQKLEPWDVGYWAEKQRRALYDFDEEELRPYFPAERVVEGMFAIVERLYGIQGEAARWRSRVASRRPVLRSARSRRRAAGRVLRRLVSARIEARRRLDGSLHYRQLCFAGRHFEPHLGCICGNLTPPIGDKPALLTHREVETIFHEFGHLLHHVLSRVEVRSLAGTAVAWDFVELPSQIMENWCWEREALDLFARHYQTGDSHSRGSVPEDGPRAHLSRRQRADAPAWLRIMSISSCIASTIRRAMATCSRMRATFCSSFRRRNSRRTTR